MTDKSTRLTRNEVAACFITWTMFLVGTHAFHAEKGSGIQIGLLTIFMIGGIASFFMIWGFLGDLYKLWSNQG